MPYVLFIATDKKYSDFICFSCLKIVSMANTNSAYNPYTKTYPQTKIVLFFRSKIHTKVHFLSMKQKHEGTIWNILSEKVLYFVLVFSFSVTFPFLFDALLFRIAIGSKLRRQNAICSYLGADRIYCACARSYACRQSLPHAHCTQQQPNEEATKNPLQVHHNMSPFFFSSLFCLLPTNGSYSMELL